MHRSIVASTKKRTSSRVLSLFLTAITIAVSVSTLVPASASTIRMIFPSTGPITATFDKYCVSGSSHSGNGYDINGVTGDSVVAAFEGTVTSMPKWTTSYGWHIRISHTAGYETLYAHLSAFQSGIAVGTKVTRGQLIGKVGETGNANGDHLHFWIGRNGAGVDLDSVLSCGEQVTRGAVIPFVFRAGYNSIGVARPQADNTFQWLLRNANSAGGVSYTAFAYGNKNTDVVLSGDWDGNGTETIGVARRATDGTFQWYLRNTNSAGGPSYTAFAYGQHATDVPVVGDWNGDGIDTIGVARRASDGTFQWYLRNANSAGGPSITVFAYGNASLDVPVAGDWNADGTDSVGVARRATDGTFQWYLRNANSAGGPSYTVFPFGRHDAGDRPLVGDWNADGTDTIGAVKRTSTAAWQWNLRNANSAGGASVTPFNFGWESLGDVPVAGDWNGA